MNMVSEHDILDAVKLLISRLEYTGDGVKYLYELNQILNRVKSNIYRMMDITACKEDPVDFFNISVRTSSLVNFVGEVAPINESPVMLKVYGKRSYGMVDNLSTTEFNASLDITDVFHREALYSVRENYLRVNTRNGLRDENVQINGHPDVIESRHSIYLETARELHRCWVVTAIISGIVYPEVLIRSRMKLVEQMKGSEREREGDRSKRTPSKEGVISRFFASERWARLAVTNGYLKVGTHNHVTCIETHEQPIDDTSLLSQDYLYLAGFVHGNAAVIVGVNQEQLDVSIMSGPYSTRSKLTIPFGESRPLPDSLDDNQRFFEFIKCQLFSNFAKILEVSNKNRKTLVHTLEAISDVNVGQYHNPNHYRLVKHGFRYRMYYKTKICVDVEHLLQITSNVFLRRPKMRAA